MDLQHCSLGLALAIPGRTSPHVASLNAGHKLPSYVLRQVSLASIASPFAAPSCVIARTAAIENRLADDRTTYRPPPLSPRFFTCLPRPRPRPPPRSRPAGRPLPAAPSFPADNIWNTRVDRLPVDPRSRQYVASIGADETLKADFAAGRLRGRADRHSLRRGAARTSRKVAIQFSRFGDEAAVPATRATAGPIRFRATRRSRAGRTRATIAT